MATRNDIKLAFIRRSCERYGKETVEAMVQAAKRMKVKDRGDLLASIGFKVASRDNAQGGVEIIMADHGPFQDMGVGRGASLAVTNGKRRSRLTRRRPKKFYSPVAYGHLNSLIGMLQFGLVEEVVEEIKNELQNQNRTS